MVENVAPAESGAYEKLRASILAFDLLPGERLSERGLEEGLGASRTPIRAALLRLENEGLTARIGRGWQVAPIDLSEVRAVMEFRETVEVGVVARAVERADEAELRALRELVGSHRESDDRETGLRDGGDFHLALARLSRNTFMVDAMAGSLTRLSRTRWLEVRTPESRALARDEHLAILAAVSGRDAGRAAELVTAHCRGTRERLLAFLSEERRRLRGRGFSIIESASPARRLGGLNP